ncbi:12906_t:CDS:2, partial [Cetraspora pellucida]
MSTNLSYNLQETLLHCNQDELQEFLTDVQTLDNEDNYDDNPLFNFEQNFYEEIEEIEEIGSEYSEEIPATTQKPTTLCVIIDNDYGEIRRCNRISNKRLQELVGVWEIDANAVEEVNRQLQLLGVYIGCIAKHSNDTTTALHCFARLIEMMAKSEDDNVKKHLLQALYSCLKNFDLNLTPARINKLPSLFVVNTAFKVKGLDFSKQLKQFTLKPKKCEEFGKSLALEILRSHTSLYSHKETLE